MADTQPIAPAASQVPPSAPVFDTAAARADGVSDRDIAAFLAPRMNFDLDAAHKDGVDDTSIVDFLAPTPEATPDPKAPESTTMGALARGAERGALPAAAGMVGFGAGAEAGGALGALGGPAAPFTVPAGALIGGLIGAYAAATSAGKAQEAGLKALPDAARAWLGQSDEQRAADLKAHPYAAFIGELAPQLATMRPGAIAKELPEGASMLRRLAANPVAARLAGAGLFGGQEAAQEAAQGEDLNPTKIAISAGIGAFANKPTALGERLTGVGAAPVEAITSRIGARARVGKIMGAGNVDQAIADAQEGAKGEPVDIEAMGAQAQAEAERANPEPSFGGLNSGHIEQDESGNYTYRGPDQTGQETTVPMRAWEPADGGDGTISPGLAQAQRDHYAQLGVNVVYFHDDPTIPFDGAVDPDHPDTIFLSNDPSRNAAQVGAHEVTHILEDTELPDGTNLGDLLHQQVRQGITDEGRRHAQELFGASAPAREAFPEGEQGDADHADAVVSHLITELGADIGGEAPKFQTFAPKIIDAVQSRFGMDVAKDVLQKLIDGIQSAMNTLRKFFGPEPTTVSQNWVSNLDEIHDTLAKMYAAKYGEQIVKEGVSRAADETVQPVRQGTAPTGTAVGQEVPRGIPAGVATPEFGARPTGAEVVGEPIGFHLSIADDIANLKIDNDHTVPYEAGSSNDGKTIYFDSHLPETLDVQRTDGGSAPMDPRDFLKIHEYIEHGLMTGQLALRDGEIVRVENGPNLSYKGAHEIATGQELAAVKRAGFDAADYQRQTLDFAKKVSEPERIANPPADLYTKPYPHTEAEFIARQGQKEEGPSLGPAPGLNEAVVPLARDMAAADVDKVNAQLGRFPISTVAPTERAEMPVPRKPLSLVGFIKSIGGIKDDVFGKHINTERGRLAAMRQGSELRDMEAHKISGLIKPKAGKPIDEIAEAAGFAGYFPELGGERPEPNHIIDALRSEIVEGKPRFSDHDQEAVRLYQEAVAHNDQLDRIAAETGIDHTAMTKAEFWNAVAEHESLEDAARMAEDRDAAAAHDFAEAEHRARMEILGHGDAWEPDEIYGDSTTRSLEDLEREDRSEQAAPAKSPSPGGSQRSPTVGRNAEPLQEGGRQRGRGAGVGGRGEPQVERTAQGEQHVIPGAEQSARQAAQAREDAGHGKIRGKGEQLTDGEGLFAPADRQKTLFSPKSRSELPDKAPEDIIYRDQVSALIDAATGEAGEKGLHPAQSGKGMGNRGQTIGERMERIAAAGSRQIKNLNPIEADTIFPRTLAALDDLSAKLWNRWLARDAEGKANAEALRRVVSDSLVKLPAESRDRVYAAIELARKWSWRPPDDGKSIRVKNTSYWQARKSKVGDDYVLSPDETRAFHDTMKLGDEGWRTFMRALAAREGWTGDLDPGAINEAAQEAGDKTPRGKQLKRLAIAIGEAQLALNRPYFPAARFGDYFIAVKPKLGVDLESEGGYPKVEWFETVEKPAMADILGKSRQAANDVQGVKDAIARIRSLRKPDGSFAFPEETHEIETGDLRTRPDILRKLNIPAIEKLFMLMERNVTESVKNKIIEEGSSGENLTDKEAAGLTKEARAEAKANYKALLGETKDALLDAIYQDLLAGFKKPAQLIPGYSEDFDRAIGAHIGQIGHNAADMAHRNGIEEAYQEIQDNHPHKAVRTFWKHWREYQEDPRSPLSRASSNVAQAGALYVMGLNPSTTIMIAAHTPMMAIPVMSVGGNLGQATLQMGRALREAYAAASFSRDKGAFIDTSKLGKTEAERKLIADLDATGLNHSIGADDVRAINDRQSGLWGQSQPLMRRAMDIAMSNISVVDQANRNAIALAVYRMASNPAVMKRMAVPWMEYNAIFRDMAVNDGLTPENFAKFMMSEAGGAWGRTNQAVVMRGAEGSLLFALHGFQTRYLSTAYRLMVNMGPEGRAAGTFMMAALALGAGVYGLPFTQDAENAGEALWKKIAGTDPMIDVRVRQFLADNGFSKAGAQALLRGPLSVALGTDLGSRIGFGDILSRSFEAGDAIGTYPFLLWHRLNAAWERYRSGQGSESVLAELMPSAIRNPMRADIESEEGRLAASGTRELTAEQLQGNSVRTALGLPSLEAEQAFERYEYLSRLGERDKELRQQIAHQAANLMFEANKANREGDVELARSISARMGTLLGDYNKTHWQAPVTSKEVGDVLMQLSNPEIYQRMRLPHALQGEAQRNPYP